MLTIKLITENTDAVIRGLEKKHFKGAKESIDKVLELNDKRRIAQNQLDKNLAEVNATSKSIGQLMKEGKKEEAEAAKKHVSEIKEVSKALQTEMDQAAEELQNLLYTIPNVPYDEVPEGTSAEDNVVEKREVWKRNFREQLFRTGIGRRNRFVDFDWVLRSTEQVSRL